MLVFVNQCYLLLIIVCFNFCSLTLKIYRCLVPRCLDNMSEIVLGETLFLLQGCAFHFMEIFRFMEIQSAFCLYPQMGLEFFN